jgi:hypothetical protein
MGPKDKYRLNAIYVLTTGLDLYLVHIFGSPQLWILAYSTYGAIIIVELIRVCGNILIPEGPLSVRRESLPWSRLPKEPVFSRDQFFPPVASVKDNLRAISQSDPLISYPPPCVEAP